jgi:anti-sigma regulatory factor (Ser/Thr protein kinase)
MLRLSVPASREAIGPLRDALDRHLEPHGLAPRDRYRIDLLVEEVLMNVVLHGFADSPSADPHSTPAVDFTVDVQPERVQLGFSDGGKPFDPTTAAPRPPPASLADAEPGGLGLPLLLRFADSLDYRREGGRNHLTITLNRA